MKVALYCRVSTDEQATKGTSIADQLYQLRRKAQYEGWQVAGEYLDEGVSGTSDRKRHALHRLMRDAKLRLFDAVLVSRLDRFFRKLRLLLEYVSTLNDRGVSFVSIAEAFDTSTSHGRFTLNIMGSMAEWERDQIVERTKRGRLARYREHKWASGQPLFGYQYNRSTGKLEVREDEAVTVRRIFNLYVFQRLGFVQIARQLNADGIRPRQHATRWLSSAVSDTLKHPGYKGKHPLGVDLPAIIDSELWDLAQKRRRDNKRLHRREGSAWLLQAMVKCGLCGHSLACVTFHGRRVYSCRGRRQDTYPDADHKCTLPNLDAKWLEERVIANIMNALGTPEGMEKAITDTIQILESRTIELEKTIKPIDHRLQGIDAKLERLAESWVVGAIGTEKVAKKRQQLEAERERLTSLKAEADPRQIEEYEDVKHRITVYRRELERIKTGGRDGSVPLMELPGVGKPPPKNLTDEDIVKMQRQLLDRLQVNLWLYPDRVEIRALIPVKHLDIQGSNPDYS